MKKNNKFYSYLEFIQQSLPYGYIIKKEDFLYVFTEKSKWRINLKDKKRFGRYSIFHLSLEESLKENKDIWHKQISTNNIYYSLFLVFTHDISKENSLSLTNKDYNIFLEKFNRYLILKDIKSYIEDNNIDV